MGNNILENRIKELRKEMHVRTESDGKVRSLSREALGEYLNCTRQRIAAMESDINIATVGEIKKLCELFECDAAYLFGEIDTKRRYVADIHEMTSLSESASQALILLASDVIHPDGKTIKLHKEFQIDGISDCIDLKAFFDDLLSDGDVPFWLAIIYSRLITEGARNPQKECQYRYFLFSEFEKFVRNAVEKARKAVAHGKADEHRGLDSGSESLED